MIKKILTGDYLKGYGEMSDRERSAYQKKVRDWLNSDGARLLEMTDRPMARSQNLITISLRWSRADCDAVREGVRLLTALVAVADTWLPSLLWTKSAWRAVRHICETLSQTPSQQKANTRDVKVQQGQQPAKQAEAAPKSAAHTEKPQERPAALPAPLPTDKKAAETVTGVPRRPKHIDQYVHLLPKDTQERASHVKDLLRQLDIARQNANRLMEAGEQGDRVAQWSKAAAQTDEKLGRIYRELDAEWEKLVRDGRVTVDDLGNAHVTQEATGVGTADKTVALTSEQKHRRRDLRKWLIDLRRGGQGKAREARIAQWKVFWKEYLTLEPLDAALKDDKIVAAAKHFGITITANR